MIYPVFLDRFRRLSASSRGYALIGLCVLGDTLVPLAIVLWSGGVSPLLWISCMRLGAGAGLFLMLCIWRPRIALSAQALRVLAANLRRPHFAAVIFALLSWMVFAFSVDLAGPAIPAAATAANPIIFMIFMRLSPGLRARQAHGLGGILLYLPLGVAGFLLVVVSDHGFVLDALGGSGWRFWLGVALSLAPPVISSFSTYSFRWSMLVLPELMRVPVVSESGCTSEDMYGFAGLWLISVSCLGLCLVFFPLGFFLQAPLPVSHSFFVILFGVVPNALANMGMIFGNSVSDRVGVNALLFLVPGSSVVLLWCLGYISVDPLWLLAAGVVLVMVCNLLVRFADLRRG